MTLNRASGLAVALIGVVLVFWIIPSQTEIMKSGWLKPATLPRVTAVIIIIAGIIHFLFPTGKAELDVRFSLRMGLFFGIGLMGIYAMDLVGFLVVAPILILVIMAMIGENRPFWLFAGVILVPAVIWFCVDYVLNKPLP